ncbi:uncharacterized protein L201_004062 [Kwoniella dendrophila CBS 6074]|uniref:Magnesium transporter NIPA-domain-containing protein n=1 Tax=Kwoniella dendrophila CBS 6074 TaxID=1295534 RepID=A0AAX4JUU2_9TREE
MAGVSVFVAILVGLVSSFVQSLGLTIQRKSHLIESSLPLEQRKKPLKRPLWLLGFGIYIISNIFSTIFQLDSLPIVILAPLGAISLVYNAILARLMLGDKFGKIWLIGTFLISLGAVLIAIFGVVKEEHHNLNEILKLFKRNSFIAFFTIISFLTASVIIISHIISYQVHRQVSKIQLPSDSGRSTPISIVPSNYASPHPTSPAIPFKSRSTGNNQNMQRINSISSVDQPLISNPGVGIFNIDDNDGKKSRQKKHNLSSLEISSSSENQIANSNDGLDEKQKRRLFLCGLGFACASGTLSGMCLVLAKAAVELLVLTLNYFTTGKGENEFKKIQTWFLVFGLIICAILQLVYLNYSLTFASPAIIAPLAFCFFNLSSIFDGLVFYDQFSRLSTLQITFVSLGVAILLLGVWVVSAVQPDQGVDMGTWVEEESDTESIIDEDPIESMFPNGSQAESPTGMQNENDRVDSLSGTMNQNDQDRMTRSYPQLQLSMTPEILDRSVFSNPEYPSTPTSPMSPTTRRRHYHHRMRYGSLIPDVLPQGAPTGFSIGLGAASPGFALRSGSFSIDGNFHPHHGNITSTSNSPLIGGQGEHGRHVKGHLKRFSWSHSKFRDQQSIDSAIINGQDDQGYEARTEEEEEQDPLNSRRIEDEGEHPNEVDENRVEGELREWTEQDENGNQRRKAWWEKLFGRLPINQQQGRVRLEGDERI